MTALILSIIPEVAHVIHTIWIHKVIDHLDVNKRINPHDSAQHKARCQRLLSWQIDTKQHPPVV